MFLTLIFVFGYPLVQLINLSLHRTVKGQAIFVGLKNYATIFKDDIFIKAVQNNLTLVLSVPVMIFIALILSIFLFERIRGWKLYQTTLFLPYLLPIVVVGLIFSYIFQLSGVLNDFLKSVGLGALALDWLGSTKYALWTVLARLMSVEEELFDAAKIDGANWWQLQWHITIPQLSGVLEFFTVISVITMLSWVFNYVFVMTSGGPGNSTMVTELYVYLQGFRYHQMNIAAATSVLLLLATGILIFVQFRLREGQGEETLA
jgi:ABC-type sugar transport system permease subunit